MQCDRARTLNGKARNTEAIGPLRVTVSSFHEHPSIVVEGEYWWLFAGRSCRSFYPKKFTVVLVRAELVS